MHRYTWILAGHVCAGTRSQRFDSVPECHMVGMVILGLKRGMKHEKTESVCIHNTWTCTYAVSYLSLGTIKLVGRTKQPLLAMLIASATAVHVSAAA